MVFPPWHKSSTDWKVVACAITLTCSGNNSLEFAPLLEGICPNFYVLNPTSILATTDSGAICSRPRQIRSIVICAAWIRRGWCWNSRRARWTSSQNPRSRGRSAPRPLSGWSTKRSERPPRQVSFLTFLSGSQQCTTLKSRPSLVRSESRYSSEVKIIRQNSIFFPESNYSDTREQIL